MSEACQAKKKTWQHMLFQSLHDGKSTSFTDALIITQLIL